MEVWNEVAVDEVEDKSQTTVALIVALIHRSEDKIVVRLMVELNSGRAPAYVVLRIEASLMERHWNSVRLEVVVDHQLTRTDQEFEWNYSFVASMAWSLVFVTADVLQF
jgi:hypothetical protein